MTTRPFAQAADGKLDVDDGLGAEQQNQPVSDDGSEAVPIRGQRIASRREGGYAIAAVTVGRRAPQKAGINVEDGDGHIGNRAPLCVAYRPDDLSRVCLREDGSGQDDRDTPDREQAQRPLHTRSSASTAPIVSPRLSSAN